MRIRGHCPQIWSHLDGAGPGVRLDGGGGDEEDGNGGRHGQGPTHCHAAHPHAVMEGCSHYSDKHW